MNSYYSTSKVIVILLTTLALVWGDAFSQVSNAERDALMALYNNTDGSNWTNDNNWGSGNPVSTWYGVTVRNNEVVELNLKQNNLNGSLPDDFFDLVNLTFLHLRGNNLTGTISPLVGNLVELDFLGLNNNNFSGTIPTEIGNLIKLRELYMQDNSFEGDLPSSLSGLVEMRYFYLTNNKITGLPDLSPMASLASLRVGENALEFDDLEINNGVAPTFVYTPQAIVGVPITRNEIQGANVTLNCAIGGTANTYQWYKNGVALTGETRADLLINNIQDTDAGIYTCKAQNTIITGLTISQAAITVSVLPYTIATSAAENITGTSADVPYQVNYGATVMSEHGVVYGTSQAPESTGTKWTSGSVANGSFTATLTGLSSQTTYFARAYTIEGGITRYGNEVSFTTPEITYPILEALYNQTDGDNWFNKDNWMTSSDISTWYGLTVVNGEVVQINLSNNNLNGTIPGLSTLPQIAKVDVSGNKLEFGDLEENLDLIPLLGPDFVYAPQNTLNGSGGNFQISAGHSQVLTTICSGSDNLYTWFWWDEFNYTWSQIQQGQDNNVIVNPMVDARYKCTIESANFPGSLTIETEEFIVDVRTDRDILEEFFHHHDGVNWLQNNNWLSSIAPLNSWFGIWTDMNGRVTSITLPSNNLSGDLFEDLSELSELREINLGYDPFIAPGNNLTGSLPDSWSKLENIYVINLNGNQITGTIPDSWTSLDNLYKLDLSNNNLSGDFSEKLTEFKNLIDLRLNSNFITSIPNFAGMIEQNFSSNYGGPGATWYPVLDIQENNLEFDDIQKQVPFDLTGYGTLVFYANQAKINSEGTIVALTGRDASLTCATPGTGLEYKWWYSTDPDGLNPTWFDLNLLNDPDFEGTDSATLVIKNIDGTESGFYYCSVTNFKLPALILERENIKLEVSSFNINALLPYWYITTATGVSTMHNNIVIPPLADENGLANIKIYGYQQASGDWDNLLTTIPLSGSVTGYEFLDINSDPNVRAYSYKLSITDDLANESNKSDYQQSVHLAINLGLNNVRNLSWTHYLPEPMVTDYEVLAGMTMDVSTMTPIASLPKFLNTYTDYGTWQYYVIQTNFVPPPSPIPQKNGITYSSISNILSTLDLPEDAKQGEILVYPNPVKENAVFSFNNAENQEYTLIIRNITGQVIFRISGLTESKYELDASEITPGIYIVQTFGGITATAKMVVK